MSFKVGDWVVLINSDDADVFEYVEYSKGLDLHFFESLNNYGHAKLENIRHATPEEIAVGHRIDTPQLEVLEMIDVSPNCEVSEL